MNEPTGYTALDLVGFTDQGEYASNKNYVKNDLVHYQGNTWRCLVDDTMGVQPTEGLNWTLFIGQPSNLVEAIIAPIEETVAIATHPVGSMLIHSDTLYEVIDDIAIGDTLVDFADDPTNANIKVAPKVEEQIGAIKTDLEDAETNIGKAYKTDDSASTTIQDTDYVPMLEGNTKKKTLWSTIVSKIKSALATVASSGSYNDLSNKPGVVSTSANGLAPKVTDTSKYLRGDGTWQSPPNTTYGVVSKTANGLAPQLPNETATTKYLRQDGNWAAPPDNNTTYSAGTGTTISGSNNAINVTYGTSANTACQGNDSRLSNKREPTSHASTGTGYGVGNASNYGHVRLSDTYTSSVGAAANSIGASQTALYNVYHFADSMTQNSLVMAHNDWTKTLTCQSASIHFFVIMGGLLRVVWFSGASNVGIYDATGTVVAQGSNNSATEGGITYTRNGTNLTITRTDESTITIIGIR